MKKFISFLTLVILGTTGLVQPVLAATPQFNFMSQDSKTLVVANRTTGSGWQNSSVTVNSGNSVAFQVYYHNGVLNSTAQNTRIRLNFPTGYQNNIGVNVTLSADNAGAVTDSVTLQSSSVAQRLEIDTASIRWYPNQTQTAQYISASSSGNGYVEVNLGSIQGCWEYQGYVTFVGTLSPSTPSSQDPNLSIVKTVRNLSDSTGFADSVNADRNDELEFKLNITSTGNSAANNARVRDALPSTLNYVSGSTRIDGSYQSDGLVGVSGISLSNLPNGSGKEITFRAKVDANAYSGSAVNYAYTWADNVSLKEDTATVYIQGGSSGSSDVSIEKDVRNITDGTGWSNSVSANASDELEFRLRITSTGNSTLYNVRVRDSLPYQLDYSSGSVRVDGSYYSDDLFNSGGINIGSLSSGQTKDVTFRAYAHDDYYYSSSTLTNTGYVWADNVSQRQDEAYVYIGQGGYARSLYINKLVRNITRGEGTFSDSTNAQVGDRVQFSLRVTNSGNQNLYNVYVRDALPSYLDYVYGSFKVDNTYQGYGDSVINESVNIGSLYQNRTKEITFEATVRSNASGTLMNYGYARADNVAEVSDYAYVYLSGTTTGDYTLEKTVANTTRPNGSGISNEAYVGENLRYTLTFKNQKNTTLYNVRLTDVLPSYVAYVSSDNGGAYNSGNNSLSWTLASLQSGQSWSVSYLVKVNNVPANNTVIRNTALAQADSISSVASNEVVTTVITGQVLGIITAKSGQGDLIEQMILTTLLTLLALILFYVWATRREELLQGVTNFKLNWARWKNR